MPKRRVINFLDLGSGGRMERALDIATRSHRSKERRVEAVDLEAPSRRVSAEMKYSQKDALRRLREINAEGTKVRLMNGDNFFVEHQMAAAGKKCLQGRERCDLVIRQPINPELLTEIKKALPRNGRLYTTTVLWHCEPLAERLRQEGFEVSFRPITKEEAQKGPYTTKGYYEMWKRGEFSSYFGLKGWELQRLLAIKRR